MGADSERKTSMGGDWSDCGYTLCPESEHPDHPASSPADYVPGKTIAKAQDISYPDKTAPGANRSKESKGTV